MLDQVPHAPQKLPLVGRHRIIIASQPFPCEELLAVPEVARKGAPRSSSRPPEPGSQPLTAAEVLGDDTREVEPSNSRAAPSSSSPAPTAGERGKLALIARGKAGGAQGVIDVDLCE